MKLIFCKKCQDIVRLRTEEERSCFCGSTSGAYDNELDAWYKGESAIPLGIANSTLSSALYHQPENGMGEEFTAFVIAKECETFKKRE